MLATAPGLAQKPHPRAPEVPERSVTAHSARIAGVRIAYTAIVEAYELRDEAGTADASLVTTTYVREAVPDRDRRPVLFAFNGGPGASSSPLHLSGVGPRVVSGDSLVDNEASLLDVADLVFIDPVGTGFSRPYTTDAGKRRYWTRTGDARSVAEVITRWLREHGRERSPRYLLGESYGAVRAAAILHEHDTLRFDGVLLVAIPARDGARGDESFIGALPSMATSAWYWERIDRAGRSVDAVYAEASAFARGPYADALRQGDALPSGERVRLAEQMAHLVGLPPAHISAKKLRLTNEDWMQHVLADRGLRTGMLDTRVTAPRDTTRTGGLSDPALNGGTMRIGTAMLAPALIPGSTEALAAQRDRAQMPRIERYLRDELGYATIEQYRPLNLDINGVWQYDGGMPVAPLVAEALRRDPHLRALWTNGYYDLTTPAFAAERLMTRAMDSAGVPPERLTTVLVAGAHGVFGDRASRDVVATRVRRWISAGSTNSPQEVRR